MAFLYDGIDRYFLEILCAQRFADPMFQKTRQLAIAQATPISILSEQLELDLKTYSSTA